MSSSKEHVPAQINTAVEGETYIVDIAGSPNNCGEKIGRIDGHRAHVRRSGRKDIVVQLHDFERWVTPEEIRRARRSIRNLDIGGL